MKKMFHSFIGDADNFGSLISRLIATKIWEREDELFSQYSKYGNFDELETVFMPKSSFGFAALAVKNTSFDKIYIIKLYNKEIGKKKKEFY